MNFEIYFLNFGSTGWAFHTNWSKCSSYLCVDVDVDVNYGGTNRNTETCNLTCTYLLMNSDHVPTQNQVSPTWLIGQNRPSKKVGVNRHSQANWASQPMGCLLFQNIGPEIHQIWSRNIIYKWFLYLMKVIRKQREHWRNWHFEMMAYLDTFLALWFLHCVLQNIDQPWTNVEPSAVW